MAPGPGAPVPLLTPLPEPLHPPIRWRRSRPRGQPFAGRLQRGVRLPAAGRDFFTWDPVRKRKPNRAWRRWGTHRLVRRLIELIAAYRTDNPGAPRVGIGDLSRPRGGSFGRRFGGKGHGSHQNGLDVDIWYPRLDRRERRPSRIAQIDLRLAQELVDRLMELRPVYVFVGPSTPLRGPRRIVKPLINHDDHIHLRIRWRGHDGR